MKGASNAFNSSEVILNALRRMASSMPEPKMFLGSEIVPALELPKADSARTVFLPDLLIWKWTRP
ncbi:hypothetical protein Mapa_017646 [Marchantia paleacea]|nr:hypothetical protein Mapa_017646 [Marchantia paleacea]